MDMAFRYQAAPRHASIVGQLGTGYHAKTGGRHMIFMTTHQAALINNNAREMQINHK